MQVRRRVFFARLLREQFELGIKKAASRGFFSSGRTARFGPPLTPFATTSSARGEPVTLTEIGTSAWYATLNVVEVGFDDEPEAFSNINTREELHTWEDVPPD
jgi:hypothetical protein